MIIKTSHNMSDQKGSFPGQAAASGKVLFHIFLIEYSAAGCVIVYVYFLAFLIAPAKKMKKICYRDIDKLTSSFFCM